MANAALVNRTFDWVLDQHGDLYGDEQERLRWYEATTAVANVQWILLPWIGAVCLFLGGRAVAPTVIALTVAIYLPMWLAVIYVRSWRVRTVPDRWTGKRITLFVLGVVPYILIVMGTVLAYGSDRAPVIGAAVGGTIGLAAGIAGLQHRHKRERADQLDPIDVE